MWSVMCSGKKVVIDLNYEWIETCKCVTVFCTRIRAVVIDLTYEGIETLSTMPVNLRYIRHVVIDLTYEGIETMPRKRPSAQQT